MAWNNNLALEIIAEFASVGADNSQDATDYEAKMLAERRASDAQHKQLKRRGRLALGLCARCDLRRVPGSIRHCEMHHVKNREEAKQRRERNRMAKKKRNEDWDREVAKEAKQRRERNLMAKQKKRNGHHNAPAAGWKFEPEGILVDEKAVKLISTGQQPIGQAWRPAEPVHFDRGLTALCGARVSGVMRIEQSNRVSCAQCIKALRAANKS
jgi:hypothetical protein